MNHLKPEEEEDPSADTIPRVCQKANVRESGLVLAWGKDAGHFYLGLLHVLLLCNVKVKADHSYLFQNGNFGTRKGKNKLQGRKPMENSGWEKSDFQPNQIPTVQAPNL
ncbi:hypothetical protein AVEN_210746-1 [Araneus ventricosus]|uniref:Uncharacterized protein n=1 Tax=Araneus ventricosus TaxID=182803 RepID=A0A4Y2VK58_ARAVE|nr:hypothetical protein AVEN_210746-1 [Araneus ventricosus]